MNHITKIHIYQHISHITTCFFGNNESEIRFSGKHISILTLKNKNYNNHSLHDIFIFI